MKYSGDYNMLNVDIIVAAKTTARKYSPRTL